MIRRFGGRRNAVADGSRRENTLPYLAVLFSVCGKRFGIGKEGLWMAPRNIHRRLVPAGWVMLALTVTAQAEISDIERHVRDDWRDYVNEVSGWAPPDWKPSLHWFATLLYLPLLGHLIEGYPAPQWLSTDSFVPSLAASEAGSLQSAIAVTALAPPRAARTDQAPE